MDLHLIQNSILDPEKQKIVDFRNLLVHHYFGIDENAIWGVVEKDLSDFKRIVVKNIQQFDTEIKKELIQDFIDENSYLDFVVKYMVLLNNREV